MEPAKNAASDEPHTSPMQLLKAVEAALEIEEAALTSDSQRRVALLTQHDHVLLQCQRQHRGLSGILNLQSSSERPEGARKLRNFDESAPVLLSNKHSRDAFPGFPGVGSKDCLLG
ncbi:hypothetical protein T484DRAFT_1897158 [Baffinella frigidus]|nr:hypothetical protein T484DRAFT_1897158 [Cryptophyta sp. CCMP2293]